jgi:hypothetical protein
MAQLIALPGIFGEFSENDTQRIISGEENAEVEFSRLVIHVDPLFIVGVNDTDLKKGDIKEVCLARCRDGSAFFIEMKAGRLVKILNKYRTLDLTFSMQ